MTENIDEVVEKVISQIPTWKKILSVRDVARLLGVGHKTVLNYINHGFLPTLPLPSKQKKIAVHKILKEDLQEFLQGCRKSFYE